MPIAPSQDLSFAADCYATDQDGTVSPGLILQRQLLTSPDLSYKFSPHLPSGDTFTAPRPTLDYSPVSPYSSSEGPSPMPAEGKPEIANHDPPSVTPGGLPTSDTRARPSSSPTVPNYPSRPQLHTQSPDAPPPDRPHPSVQISHERHTMEDPNPRHPSPPAMDAPLSHMRSTQAVNLSHSPTASYSRMLGSSAQHEVPQDIQQSSADHKLDAQRGAYPGSAPYSAYDRRYPGPQPTQGYPGDSAPYNASNPSYGVQHASTPPYLHPVQTSPSSLYPPPPRSGGSSHPSNSPNNAHRSPPSRGAMHDNESPQAQANYQLPSPAMDSASTGSGNSPSRLPNQIGGRLFTSLTLPNPLPGGPGGPPSDSGHPSAGSTGGHSSVSLSPDYERHSSSGDDHYSSSMRDMQYTGTLLPDVVDAYGQDAGELKARRHRTTPRQFQALTAVYNRTAFPSTQERLQLAERLGMQPRQVQIWFQNRRQQEKNRVNRGVPQPPMLHRNVGRPRVERIPHEGGPEQTREWILREARERPDYYGHYGTGYPPPHPPNYGPPPPGYRTGPSHGYGPQYPPPPPPHGYGPSRPSYEGPPPSSHYGPPQHSGGYPPHREYQPNPGSYGPPARRDYPPREYGGPPGSSRDADMYDRYVNEEPRRDDNGGR